MNLNNKRSFVMVMACAFATGASAWSAPIGPEPGVTVLIAGVAAREARAVETSGYVVKESYWSHDPAVMDRLEQIQPHLMTLQKMGSHLSLYFWASDGLKVRNDERTSKSRVPFRDFIRAYDGDRTLIMSGTTAQYYTQPQQVPWGFAGLLQLPESGSMSISKQMQERPCHVTGIEELGGVVTYKLEGGPSAAVNSKITWWIAPELDYMVVKSEEGPTNAVPKWRHVRVVDQVERVDDVWVPIVTRLNQYLNLNGSQDTWSGVQRFSVLSPRLNQLLADQLFSVPLRPGMITSSREQPPSEVPGDKESFDARWREAKLRGEQPDMDSIDIQGYLARVNAEQPPVADTLDMPVNRLFD